MTRLVPRFPGPTLGWLLAWIMTMQAALAASQELRVGHLVEIKGTRAENGTWVAS